LGVGTALCSVILRYFTLDSIGFHDQFLVNEATPHLNIPFNFFKSGWR
jgi:hypothetical protein